MSSNARSGNSAALDAAIAATRFGLGACPGEIAQASGDPQGWLIAQIRPQGAEVFEGLSAEDAGSRVKDFREQVRGLQAEYGRSPGARKVAIAAAPGLAGAQPMVANNPGAASMTGATIAGEPSPMTATGGAQAQAPTDDFQMRRRALYMPLNQASLGEVLARTQLACATPAGFRERWALFWSNHFTTATVKSQEMRVLAPVFEREAIRPHVFDRFETLLIASSLHPGMLAYLDQQQSVGPNSPQVQRAALRQGPRQRGGLNENLAREIMELHTVGADGGYTQGDVTEFARALTGYGIASGQPIDGPTPIGSAVFREVRHEPGARTVMGVRYLQEGSAQARAILTNLAAKPQTARRLCAKIAAHFVSDRPDPRLVARLEAAWIRSHGDLSQVAQALVRAPEAWAPQPLKLKTPYELIVSSYRAAGAAPQNVQREVIGPLSAFGQRPFEAPQPNGWSDEAIAWAAPDALVKRLTWAQGFAGAYAPQSDVASFAQQALGARLAPATAQGMARAESRPEAVALLIMSPEFQRR